MKASGDSHSYKRIPALHRYVMRRTSALLERLRRPRHPKRETSGGQRWCRDASTRRGATFALNVADTNGRVIPYVHT
jgi:hypothetical protein